MATITVLPQRPGASDDPSAAGTTTSRTGRTEHVVERLRAASTDAERQQLVHELIEVNVPVARALASGYRNRGIDLDDLRQVALMGLTKAAQRFDPESGHDFLVFAVPTMRGELRRHFRDSGWMIRVPRRIQELQARIGREQHVLHARLGRAPLATELADHLAARLEDVVEALAAEDCFRPTSLEVAVGGDDGTSTLGDLLGWEDPGLASVEARVVLGTLVGQLSERDQRILHWRFVDERTQQEIAELAGVTQTQVSRILTRLLSRLRDSLSEPAPAA
ncbi:SigB/SigF/SigG family RNA polymerase sigma factor [Nocardioides zeicaulis]|uniref:SigB/SigF/SigG family RNA polymerase sigma factor n=1 Tax=Nocardioides zeicaulis TaxID=1776857 RepID=A0ABV6E4E7_9ACTN